MNYCAIVIAAGASTRMGGKINKVLMNFNSKPVIRQTLEAFQNADIISSIVLVCPKGETEVFKNAAKGISKPLTIVVGGSTRQDSVAAGVSAAKNCHVVVIHDGARPLISTEKIEEVCKAGVKHGAATLAVKVKDTIKIGDENGFISATPQRDSLWQAQTPQVFLKKLYLAALEKATRQGKSFTDDCQLLENAGEKVFLCTGDYKNLKLTTPEDFTVAAALMNEGEKRNMKIGHGYDVHRLAPERALILGGVNIPFEKGLLGHSDADVLLHAVSDALLGAACLGDIGLLFPDSNPDYKGANSLDLLKIVVETVNKKGLYVENLDCTIIAQEPKLRPFIDEMRTNIALACKTSPENINVKATTEEGLGFTGAKQGIAAHCVCILS